MDQRKSTGKTTPSGLVSQQCNLCTPSVFDRPQSSQPLQPCLKPSMGLSSRSPLFHSDSALCHLLGLHLAPQPFMKISWQLIPSILRS